MLGGAGTGVAGTEDSAGQTHRNGTDPQKRGPATSAQEQRQPMELELGVHCNR